MDDFIDVSEIEPRIIIKHDVGKDIPIDRIDVHLSDVLSKKNKETEIFKSNLQSVQEPVKQELSKKSTPAHFHPKSQIQLYHGPNQTAAVIRLGRMNNDLITIVVDLCFYHTGKAEDWNNQSSVAFSIDELLQAYYSLKLDSNAYHQNLKFHTQHKNVLKLSCDKDSITIDTSTGNKQLYIKGYVAHKIKFFAMVESAVNHYFATSFPLVENNIIDRM